MQTSAIRYTSPENPGSSKMFNSRVGPQCLLLSFFPENEAKSDHCPKNIPKTHDLYDLDLEQHGFICFLCFPIA